MSTFAWGSDNVYADAGVLGLGITALKPTTPTATALPIGVVCSEVKSNAENAIFLTTTGDVYVTGVNDGTQGVLGIGTTDALAHPTPILLSLPPIAHIACAGGQYFALASSGDLYAWGVNSFGSLGLGHNSVVTIPTLTRTGVAKVTSGDFVAHVLDLDGTVHAAGFAGAGQIGNGLRSGPDQSLSAYWTWTATAIGESVFDVYDGSQVAWIILNDGTVKATGNDGGNGQLGYSISNVGGVSTWTVVDHVSNIVQILSDSPRCTWYLDSSGNIWFYGANSSVGNSGTGSTTSYTRGRVSTDTPDLVLMPVAALSLSSGTSGTNGTSNPASTLTSCGAIGTDHLYYTWGFGSIDFGAGLFGFSQGSGADAFANPTPHSINGLTGVGYATMSTGSVFFVIADLTFATSLRVFAQVIG